MGGTQRTVLYAPTTWFPVTGTSYCLFQSSFDPFTRADNWAMLQGTAGKQNSLPKSELGTFPGGAIWTPVMETSIDKIYRGVSVPVWGKPLSDPGAHSRVKLAQ